MPEFRYATTYLFPIVAFGGLVEGGFALLLLPLITFGLIPLLEMYFVGTEENLTEEGKKRGESLFYNLLLYGFLPLQILLITTMSFQIGAGNIAGWDILGAIGTVGICCGSFGINVAHELGHKNSKFEQFLSKALLLTSLYMHFFIEHNRGHHLRAATPDDPATSEYGTTVYFFWKKSIIHSYLSAWNIEARRLERKKLPQIHWRNEMIWYQIIQATGVFTIGYFFGLVAMVAFVCSAFIGILLLETINYIEHYGLKRNRRPNGKFERVQTHHSWNSNHVLGRTLLFELTRHSDHHAYSSRPYPALRHFEASPQLPYGYPAMIILALVPSIWFAIMNPQLERELFRLKKLAS